MLEVKHIFIGSASIAYAILGKNKIDLVIEMGLGSSIGEWWQVAKRLSKTHTVLLYERAGYGNSLPSDKERTPLNIANELYQLLEQLEHEESVTLLAHSQGGLYAQQFARLYPQHVKALILLDPLSAYDNDFKTLLTSVEYKRSGVDKTGGFKLGYILSRLHLGFIIKKIMKTAPPFYYYKDFSNEETKYILSTLTKPTFYKTAMEEYRLAHREEEISGLKEKKDFPDIPIYLITHTSKMAIREIIEFGGLDEVGAKKVEEIWHELMKAYLALSHHSYFTQAKHSTHYIHLTELDVVCDTLERIYKKNS